MPTVRDAVATTGGGSPATLTNFGQHPVASAIASRPSGPFSPVGRGLETFGVEAMESVLSPLDAGRGDANNTGGGGATTYPVTASDTGATIGSSVAAGVSRAVTSNDVSIASSVVEVEAYTRVINDWIFSIGNDIADTFGRTVSSGWGSPSFNNGGATGWTNDAGTAADFSVTSGTGAQVVMGAGTTHRMLLGVDKTGTVIGQANFSFPTATSAGTGYQFGLGLRSQNAGSPQNLLRGVAVLDGNGNLTCQVQQNDAGTLSSLGQGTVASGSSGGGVVVASPYTAGDVYILKVAVYGEGPVGVACKCWKVGNTEPVAWTDMGYAFGTPATFTHGDVTFTFFAAASTAGTTITISSFTLYDLTGPGSSVVRSTARVFTVTASDTGVTVASSVGVVVNRLVTSSDVVVGSSVAVRLTPVLTGAGASIGSSVAVTAGRAVTDAGSSIGSSVVMGVNRIVVSNDVSIGSSASGSVSSGSTNFPVTASDTGVTVGSAVAITVNRIITGAGATISSTVVPRAGPAITSTGATIGSSADTSLILRAVTSSDVSIGSFAGRTFARPITDVGFAGGTGGGAVATRGTAVGDTGTGTAQTVNVTIPAATQAGDLILVLVSSGNHTTATITTIPSGYTLYDDQTYNTAGSPNSGAIYYRLADSNDAGTVETWGLSSAVGRWAVGYLVLSGVDQLNPLDAVTAPTDVLPSAASTTISFPSITPNTAGDLLLAIASIRITNTTGIAPSYTPPSAPVGMSQLLEDHTLNTTLQNAGVVIFGATYNSVSATGAMSATVNTNVSYVGMSAVVKAGGAGDYVTAVKGRGVRTVTNVDLNIDDSVGITVSRVITDVGATIGSSVPQVYTPPVLVTQGVFYMGTIWARKDFLTYSDSTIWGSGWSPIENVDKTIDPNVTDTQQWLNQHGLPLGIATGVATNFDQGSGFGNIHPPAGGSIQTIYADPTSMQVADTEQLVKARFSGSAPALNTWQAHLYSRYDLTDYYRAFIVIQTSGALQLKVQKHASSTLTDLITSQTIAASYTANDDYWLRFITQGTALKLRMWKNGTTEPTAWTINLTDSSVTAAQAVAWSAQAGASSGTVTVSFSNWMLLDPTSARGDSVGISLARGYSVTASDTGVTVGSSVQRALVVNVASTGATIGSSVAVNVSRTGITDTGVTVGSSVTPTVLRSIAVTSAGTSIGSSVAITANRVISSAGVTVGSSVTPNIGPGVTSAGATITSSVSRFLAAFRTVTDTGVTVGSSLSASVGGSQNITNTDTSIGSSVSILINRLILSTGATITSSVSAGPGPVVASTGVTIGSSVVVTAGRSVTSIGSTISSTLVLATLRNVTSTGATISSVAAVTSLVSVTSTGATITSSVTAGPNRTVTSTGVTISDSVAPTGSRNYTIADTGSSVSDVVGRGFPRTLTSVGVGLLADAIITETDNFARTVSNGWGNGWTIVSGASSAYSTDGSVAMLGASQGVDYKIRRNETTVEPVVTVDLTDEYAVTGVVTRGVMLHYQDASNYLQAVVEFSNSSGTWPIRLEQVVAGVTTILASGTHSAGFTDQTTVATMRASIRGTRFVMKIWRPAAVSEPDDVPLASTYAQVLAADVTGTAATWHRGDVGIHVKSTASGSTFRQWDNWNVAVYDRAAIGGPGVPSTYSYPISDVGATIGSSVVPAVARMISTAGAAIGSSVAVAGTPQITTAGATIGSSVAVRPAPAVQSTGATIGSSVTTAVLRTVQSTGAAISDSVSTTRGPTILITTAGATISSTLRLATYRQVTTSGAIISDSVASALTRQMTVTTSGATIGSGLTLRTLRTITDVGAAITDTAASSGQPHINVTSTGAAINDTITLAFRRIVQSNDVTIGSTVTPTVPRTVTSTGATISSAATTAAGPLVTSGVTITSTVTPTTRRPITDTGATITDTAIATGRSYVVGISTTGAVIGSIPGLLVIRPVQSVGATITDTLVAAPFYGPGHIVTAGATISSHVAVVWRTGPARPTSGLTSVELTTPAATLTMRVTTGLTSASVRNTTGTTRITLIRGTTTSVTADIPATSVEVIEPGVTTVEQIGSGTAAL